MKIDSCFFLFSRLSILKSIYPKNPNPRFFNLHIYGIFIPCRHYLLFLPFIILSELGFLRFDDYRIFLEVYILENEN